MTIEELEKCVEEWKRSYYEEEERLRKVLVECEDLKKRMEQNAVVIGSLCKTIEDLRGRLEEMEA